MVRSNIIAFVGVTALANVCFCVLNKINFISPDLCDLQGSLHTVYYRAVFKISTDESSGSKLKKIILIPIFYLENMFHN